MYKHMILLLLIDSRLSPVRRCRIYSNIHSSQIHPFLIPNSLLLESSTSKMNPLKLPDKETYALANNSTGDKNPRKAFFLNAKTRKGIVETKNNTEKKSDYAQSNKRKGEY